MQNKPNLPDVQMNISSVMTMNYEQKTMNDANKNKAKQSQFELEAKRLTRTGPHFPASHLGR